MLGIVTASACLHPTAVAHADVAASAPSPAQQAALATLLLGPSSPGLQALPTDANAALAQAINAVSADLGINTDASAPVAAAQLPAAVAGRLAVVLQDMHACDAVTAAAVQQMQPAVATPMGDSMPSIPQTSVVAIQLCAATLYTDGIALKDYVRTGTANGTKPDSSNVLDVWPVVRYDTTGAGHQYDWDYALTVATGDDRFYNNAGSNVIDPFHGAIDGQPARGCELVSEILGAGVPKCALASSLLIQVGGRHNVFGQMQSPDADAFMPGSNPPVPCTTSYLVRRLFTEGASVAGVGILMNTSTGDNLYLGKVGTQGTGHIGGVGILDVDGGDNVFSAIRNAQGFGFIAGTGILHSKQASNHFTTYMPLASAPGDASTTGTGIVDDAGNCEGRPRHLQGSGELGGAGVLYAVNSNGVYESDTVLGQGTGDVFPPGTPQPNLGGPGAAGILISRGSTSSRYTGVPGRAEGTVVVGVRSSTSPPALTATDLFDDDVFPFGGAQPCTDGCSSTAQAMTQLAIAAMTAP
ncbi:MAG TPA: hypothetical protein VN193_17550 [Candidatus Angelobacter sp.]|nr:hypothetical protein [Candidatus Angelobacter sp.]